MTSKPSIPDVPKINRPTLLHAAADAYWDAVTAWAHSHDPRTIGARDFADAAFAAAHSQREELIATSNALVGASPAATERYVAALEGILRESLIAWAIERQNPPERLQVDCSPH